LVGEEYRYAVKLRLEKSGEEEGAERQLGKVLKAVARCAEGQGWTILNKDLSPVQADEGACLVVTGRDTRPPFEVPALTDGVLKEFFAGVYERDEHIRVIHDAVTNYVATLNAWREDPSVEVARSHILLKGKPAGAKTSVFERFKAWYEAASPGAERVSFIDMHVSTRAGIEDYLLDKAEQGELGDIIVLEEIEKQAHLDNLLPLVSLMGSGHVSKLNARVGHRRKLANVLVWATCNDEGLIRRWRNGAIWSRFAKKLHCPRPSRELMRRILLDTVEKMGGDPDWADLALSFAYDVVPQVTGAPMDDPREIKGLLEGRDRLIDFSYQQDLLTILRAERKEGRADRQAEGGPVW
jgi:hypothetical protein